MAHALEGLLILAAMAACEGTLSSQGSPDDSDTRLAVDANVLTLEHLPREELRAGRNPL